MATAASPEGSRGSVLLLSEKKSPLLFASFCFQISPAKSSLRCNGLNGQHSGSLSPHPSIRILAATSDGPVLVASLVHWQITAKSLDETLHPIANYTFGPLHEHSFCPGNLLVTCDHRRWSWRWRWQVTTHNSQLTTHNSQLTTHYSLLKGHNSQLTQLKLHSCGQN